MNFEISSELREITVNVKLTDSEVPVISTSRGWEFQPKTLHALWVRENAGQWDMVCVELKGVLPKSGRTVRRTYWCEIKDLPEWIAWIVTSTTPTEALQVSS